jgi:hypothetical protein
VSFCALNGKIGHKLDRFTQAYYISRIAAAGLAGASFARETAASGKKAA